MASGPLTFRTPHIEEIPIAQTKQAPGFAWVAVAKDVDPATKQLEIASKKRSRNAGTGQTDAQKEALSARQQRELERRLRDLNTDGSKDANIPLPKRTTSGTKDGKTPNTKKILASGKEFKHYLDDEEAELARTGKVDGMDREDGDNQRISSKAPYTRQVMYEDTAPSDHIISTIPYLSQSASLLSAYTADSASSDAIAPLPSSEEVTALLNAPPLTYTAAARAPSYNPVAPPRAFCDVCGYWGLSKCLKCGARTCSIECEAIHVTDRCLKFYS